MHKESSKEIADLVSYCPETGVFRWKIKPRRALHAGAIAGGVKSSGYYFITYRRTKYSAHRVAWLIMTGDWPPDQIDHINRDPLDNRWTNLRAATARQNHANRASVNRFGKGVFACRNGSGKFAARIYRAGKLRQIGTFPTVELAGQAYHAEAVRIHGEFALGAEKVGTQCF